MNVVFHIIILKKVKKKSLIEEKNLFVEMPNVIKMLRLSMEIKLFSKLCVKNPEHRIYYKIMNTQSASIAC